MRVFVEAERSGLPWDNSSGQREQQIQAAGCAAHSSVFQALPYSFFAGYQCSAGLMRGRRTRGKYTFQFQFLDRLASAFFNFNICASNLHGVQELLPTLIIITKDGNGRTPLPSRRNSIQSTRVEILGKNVALPAIGESQQL